MVGHGATVPNYTWNNEGLTSNHGVKHMVVTQTVLVFDKGWLGPAERSFSVTTINVRLMVPINHDRLLSSCFP